MEEDDAVYRDILLRHQQNFLDLHLSILKAYEFDQKHQATFYRSNDQWQRGREISLGRYDKAYRAEPLLMAETKLGSEIHQTNQKFIYEYDFAKSWVFLIALIQVDKEENPKLDYPKISRVEGIGPQQYGTKSLLGDKFADIEEKYDLSETGDGFGEEGDAADDSADEDAVADDTVEGNEDF